MSRKRSTKVVRYPGSSGRATRPYVASIGNFDGVHLGHRSVLEKVVESARRFDAATGPRYGTALVSFYPHPLSVVRGITDPPRLLSLRRQLIVMSELGIDLLALVHFTREISELSAHDFVEKILIDRLDVRHLVIGEDARIGKGREGTPEVIAREMAAFGRSTEVVTLLSESAIKIGSRTIRELIGGGELERAAQHLGRPYAVDGRVVRGAGRGRTLGFPTANLATHDQLLPPLGVYAVRLSCDGRRFHGVANLGARPTFESSGEVKVEVHVFDYDGESLYGKRATVEFVDKLRDERKFASVEELVLQIRIDCDQARARLSHGT